MHMEKRMPVHTLCSAIIRLIGPVCGGLSVKTHNLYHTHQSEPWIPVAWELIIFSHIINSHSEICFCCNSEDWWTCSCLGRMIKNDQQWLFNDIFLEWRPAFKRFLDSLKGQLTKVFEFTKHLWSFRGKQCSSQIPYNWSNWRPLLQTVGTGAARTAPPPVPED